jgi:hypothetical protein
MKMSTNNNKSGSASGGIRFTEALQLIFIVLKLVKVVDWSWKVVLIPTWCSLGIAVVAFLIYAFLEAQRS